MKLQAAPLAKNLPAAALTITLDPGSADDDDVLADTSLSEGALVRLLSERWITSSSLRLTPRP